MKEKLHKYHTILFFIMSIISLLWFIILIVQFVKNVFFDATYNTTETLIVFLLTIIIQDLLLQRLERGD